jgi:hypothetical protein
MVHQLPVGNPLNKTTVNDTAFIKRYPAWLTQEISSGCEVRNKVPQLSELEFAAVA